MRRAFAVCCLTLAGVASAQTSVEDALRDVKPRQACTPDDQLPPETPGNYRALPSPELACALEPAAVRAMLGKPQVVLVDTRKAAEFSEFHIDTAVNMEWSRIRVSPFAGTHTLVLIGNGKAERSLYVACSDLRRSGNANVHVLRGGMGRWVASGAPIIGRAPDLERYALLDDEDLLDELAFSSNVPLAFPKASALRGQDPRIELLARADPSALTQSLAKRGASSQPAASVLLLTGGARRASWRPFAAASAPLPLLVYEGTPEQFKYFMRQKRAMWAAQDRPLQVPCGL